MKIQLITYILAILIPTMQLLAANAGTRFQFYVPPNNDNVNRDVCVLITAFNDDTFVELVDDNADGDDDDSWSGYLQKGETYIRYIKDGLVNDDAAGKWDGDYFLVNSDKPVVVSQSTNSDWQHDWVPADNTTMKGNLFFIFAPPTSFSPRDLNIFAYEDSTFIQVKDITISPKTTTGKTSVNISAFNLVISGNLNLKEDLIYSKTDGRDILNPGSTYMVQTSKPVTIQYGALWKNERDGGGFVPGVSGSSSDNLFYFTIPNQNYKRERELRIISFDNNVNVTLEGLNGNNWQSIATYNLDAFEHSDFVATSSQDNLDLFKISSENGNISVFEANWLETGSYGTSDIYSFVSSENGDAAGNSFLVYLAPPGYEGNCVDPFTGLKYSQMGLNGLTHTLITGRYENTTVTIKDTDTDGTIIDTTISISAGRYFDFRVDQGLFEQLRSNGNRPYLTITSTQPVSIASTNWNDNWMTYMSSSQPGSLEINSSSSTSNSEPGANVTFLSTINNTTNQSVSGAITEITIADGLNYESSSLISSSQGSLGEGTFTELSSGEETVTWNNYNLNPGDSLTTEVVVQVDSVLSNGANIPNNSNVNVTTTSSGVLGSDTVVTQNTSVLNLETNNPNQINDQYVLAFEDMKDVAWNDWDVNDFIVEISSTVNIDDLERITDITFNYKALARGSAFDHIFKHKIKLYGNSIITLTVRDSTNNIVRTVGPVSRSGEFTENIFNSTKEALPPLSGNQNSTTNTSISQNFHVQGYTAILEIEVEPSQNPISIWGNGSSDPYIYVIETGKNIHVASIAGNGVGNTQNLDNNINISEPLYGYFLDLAYKFENNWKWPYEGSTNWLWGAYEEFIPYITSGKSSNVDWYLTPQETKVWQLFQSTAPNNQPSNKSLGNKYFSNSNNKTTSSGSNPKGYFSSPKLFDLDNNGTLEIFVGSLDKMFYAYDFNKNTVNGFPINTEGIIRSTAAFCKIDETNSVIAFGSDDGKLYVYNNSGQLYNGFPFESNGPIKSSPSITDIDLDGKKEIIFNSGDGKLYVISLKGKLFNDFPVKVQNRIDSYGNLVILPSPAIGDLNNDGTKEIAVGTSDSTLTVVSSRGQILPGFPVRLDNLVYSSPIITKYEDRKAILVISGSGTLTMVDYNGEILNTKNLDDEVVSSPAVADIDNNGTLEIIVSTLNGNVYSIEMDDLLSTQWDNRILSQLYSSPIIADLNGDSNPEIIVTGLNGKTYIFDNYGFLDVSLMDEISKPLSATFSTPTIGDIDKDEKLEMVTTSYNKTLEIIEFSRTNKESKILWSGFGKDIANSNSSDSITTNTISNNSLGRVFNYPNPVKEAVTLIRIEAPIDIENLKILIFDVGGELVKSISKENMEHNGFFWDYEWNLMNDNQKSISNGTYIYKVDVTVDGNNYQKIQKLAIIR